MMRNDSSGLATCIPELDMYPLLFLVLCWVLVRTQLAAVVNLLTNEKQSIPF
jgi:hypothetical protein